MFDTVHARSAGPGPRVSSPSPAPAPHLPLGTLGLQTCVSKALGIQTQVLMVALQAFCTLSHVCSRLSVFLRQGFPLKPTLALSLGFLCLSLQVLEWEASMSRQTDKDGSGTATRHFLVVAWNDQGKSVRPGLSMHNSSNNAI